MSGEEKEKRASALEASLGIRIDKDKNTGRRTIQIPVPEEEILKQVTGIVDSFLSLLKKEPGHSGSGRGHWLEVGLRNGKN